MAYAVVVTTEGLNELFGFLHFSLLLLLRPGGKGFVGALFERRRRRKTTETEINFHKHKTLSKPPNVGASREHID